MIGSVPPPGSGGKPAPRSAARKPGAKTSAAPVDAERERIVRHPNVTGQTVQEFFAEHPAVVVREGEDVLSAGVKAQRRARYEQFAGAEQEALKLLKACNPSCILRVGSFARVHHGESAYPGDVDLVVIGDVNIPASVRERLPKEVSVHFMRKEWAEQLVGAAADGGPPAARKLLGRGLFAGYLKAYLTPWKTLPTRPDLLGAPLFGPGYEAWGIQNRVLNERGDPDSGKYWMHQVLHGSEWWSAQQDAVRPVVEQVRERVEADKRAAAEAAAREPRRGPSY